MAGELRGSETERSVQSSGKRMRHSAGPIDIDVHQDDSSGEGKRAPELARAGGPLATADLGDTDIVRATRRERVDGSPPLDVA